MCCAGYDGIGETCWCWDTTPESDSWVMKSDDWETVYSTVLELCFDQKYPPTVYWKKDVVSRPFHCSYLKTNKVSKGEGIRTVEYAYHLRNCADAVYPKLSKLVHTCRNYSLSNLGSFLRHVVVFPHQTVWQYSDGNPLTGTSNARGVWKGGFKCARNRIRIINFYNSVPSTWNSLPADLRTPDTTLCSCKRHLKAHLFQQ